MHGRRASTRHWRRCWRKSPIPQVGRTYTSPLFPDLPKVETRISDSGMGRTALSATSKLRNPPKNDWILSKIPNNSNAIEKRFQISSSPTFSSSDCTEMASASRQFYLGSPLCSTRWAQHLRSKTKMTSTLSSTVFWTLLYPKHSRLNPSLLNLRNARASSAM